MISTPSGRPSFSSSSFFLTPSMVASAFSPKTHDDDTGRDLAFAIQFHDAAAQLRPYLDMRGHPANVLAYHWHRHPPARF